MFTAVWLLLWTVTETQAYHSPNLCNKTYNSETGLKCRYCEPSTFWTGACKIDGGDSECSVCPQGHYQDRCNIAHYCSLCECPYYEMEIFQRCTWTKNQVCHCPNGKYWHPDKTPGEGLCLPHSKCPKGKGFVASGTTTNNTLCTSCSLSVTYSDNESLEPCKMCTECDNYQSRCTTEKDAVCKNTEENLTYVIIPATVIPVAVIAAILGCWLIYSVVLRRRRQADHANKDVEMVEQLGLPQSQGERDSLARNGPIASGGDGAAIGNTEGNTGHENSGIANNDVTERCALAQNGPVASGGDVAARGNTEEGNKGHENSGIANNDVGDAEDENEIGPASGDDRQCQGVFYMNETVDTTDTTVTATDKILATTSDGEETKYEDTSLTTGNNAFFRQPTDNAEHNKNKEGFPDSFKNITKKKDSLTETPRHIHKNSVYENTGKLEVPNAVTDRRLRSKNDGLIAQPTSTSAGHTKDEHDFSDTTKIDITETDKKDSLPTYDKNLDKDGRLRTENDGLVAQPTSTSAGHTKEKEDSSDSGNNHDETFKKEIRQLDKHNRSSKGYLVAGATDDQRDDDSFIKNRDDVDGKDELGKMCSTSGHNCQNAGKASCQRMNLLKDSEVSVDLVTVI